MIFKNSYHSFESFSIQPDKALESDSSIGVKGQKSIKHERGFILFARKQALQKMSETIHILS